MPQKLEERSRKWDACLPEGNPSKAIDFALFHFLCSQLGYPDKSLPGDLANGVPVVGEVPDSGVFRKLAQQDSAALPDWRDGLHARNHFVVGGKSEFGRRSGASLFGKDNARGGQRMGDATYACAQRDRPLFPHPPSICYGRGTRGAWRKKSESLMTSDHRGPTTCYLREIPRCRKNIDVCFFTAPMVARLVRSRPLEGCAADFAHA